MPCQECMNYLFGEHLIRTMFCLLLMLLPFLFMAFRLGYACGRDSLKR